MSTAVTIEKYHENGNPEQVIMKTAGYHDRIYVLDEQPKGRLVRCVRGVVLAGDEAELQTLIDRSV